MPARLIVEFDDQTAPGFQQLIQNLESSDKSAETVSTEFEVMRQKVTEATKEVEVLRQTLAQTEAERAAAIQSLQKESQFVNGIMQEAGRATANTAGSAVAGYVKLKIELFLLKKAAQAAAIQLGGMAATAAAALGPAVVVAGAAKVSYEGLNFVLAETDRRFEKLRGQGEATVQYTEQMTKAIAEQVGLNVKNNEELITQLNAMRNLTDAGFKYEDALRKLQKVSEATGKSLEDLGVRSASNASEIGDAFDRLGDRLAEPFERSAHAFAEWWNSSSIIRTGLDKLEGLTDGFAAAATTSLDFVSEGWDELRVQVGRVVGANADEYREEIKNLREVEAAQERVAKAQERSKEHFASLKAANQALEEEARLEKELTRIGKLRSDEIDAEITKLKASAGEAAAAGEFKGKKEEEYTKLYRALSKRREEALKEETEAAKKSAEEQAEVREKLAKKMEDLRKTAEAELQKQMDAMAEVQAERARGEEELALQEREHRREAEIERLQNEKDTEERILQLKKQSLEDQAELERKHADTELERARIDLQLEKDLRELGHQHALDMRRKEIEAAEEAANKEREIEKQKIEAIKGLRNNQGQNLLEQLMGRQSRQQVFQEIVKRRLEKSREENPDVEEGSERRRRMDRALRNQVRQQAMRGQINPGEVAKIRGDLAESQAKELNQQGALNKETLKAITEQAKAHAAKAQFDEEMTAQMQEVQQVLREIQGGTKGREQRLRSQRRAVRG